MSKDSTRMDLGDDLLQTRTVSRPAPSGTEGGIEELLVNSKILIGEGFLDDAKTTLRRVLRLDPTNITARDRLVEIQKTEIRRLLGQEENPRSSFLRSKKKTDETESPDEVLISLEREIGTSSEPSSEFFHNPEALQDFLGSLEKLCGGASAQDRIDLGIGFLEMELYDVAVHQFQVAVRDPENEVKARGLLATAFVAQKKYFDAMIELELLVADQSIPAEGKVNFGYLAGLAQEGLGNLEAAARWYRAVFLIDPEYRDTKERMQLALKKCAKTRSSSSSPSLRS